MGRHSTYDPETAAKICERVAEGEPLRQICREKGMPPWRTVYRWLEDNKDFAARFARARDDGADAIAEDILDIIDDGRNDWMEKFAKNGASYLAVNDEAIQRSKLRAEMRLKLLAKWRPAKYGERLELAGKIDIGLAERLARARGRTGPQDDGSDLAG